MDHRVPAQAAAALVLTLTLAVAACGKKAPADAPAAPPTPATPETATTALPVDPATPRPDATEPAVVAAAADVAEPAAAAADAEQAAAPALPAEVAAALAGERAGCVGVRADGRFALVLLDWPGEGEAVAREARWIDLRGEAHSATGVGDCSTAATCAKELAAATVATRGDILGLTEGATLVACQAATATDNKASARPLGKLAQVAGGDELKVAVEGGRVVPLAAVDALDDGEGAALAVHAAYWAEALGSVFVVATRGVAGGPDAPTVEVYGVSAAELGIAPCTPRPVPGVRAEVAPVALTPDTLADEGCLAMTKDGRAALFAIVHVDSIAEDAGESGSASPELTWFGPASPPDADVRCLSASAKCSAQDHAAAIKQVAAAGLEPCRKAGAIVVDGAEVGTISEDRRRLWLTHGDGAPRWIGDLTVAPHDGGDHEAFEAAFQHGGGGPVFVLISNADTGLSEQRVRVLDNDALGFCPVPAPASGPAPGAAPAPAPAPQ